MKKLLSLFILLCLASSAYAAVDTNLFSVPLKDQSVFYLGQLFGQVGNILSGPNSSVLKGALGYFNDAVLILGGVIILYSLTVSTMNTANDGEMLGKKWNSLWIPIRSAAGFALLLPTATGYAVIQVFMIWLIIQGVGVADYIWSNTVTGLLEGKLGFQVQAQTPQSLYKQANYIFVDQVCQNVVASSLEGKPVTTTTDKMIQYGIDTLSNNPSLCGGIGLTKDATTNGDIKTLASDIQGSATSQFLQMYNASTPLTSSQINQLQRDIQNAVNQYANNQQQHNQKSKVGSTSSNDQKLQQALQEAKDLGWIYAGSYYMMITRYAIPEGGKINTFVASTPDSTSLTTVLGQSADDVFTELKTAYYAVDSADYSSGGETPQGINLKTSMDTMSFAKKIMQVVLMIKQPIYGLVNLMLKGFSEIMNYFYKHITDMTTAQINPILSLATWGNSMLDGIETMFGAFLFTIMLVGLATYSCSCVNPSGYAMGSVLAWILPFMFFIMMAVWVFGSLTAYYIPMIPFILFTFGSIAWFIAVIEAMVAAPLVALGVLHPEGQHEVFGHAHHGVMILANVFLRPVLMIIGFWASSIMVFISVALVNAGFYAASSSISTNGVLGVMGIWSSISFMMIYTLMITVVINRSFSLIYHVPDRVLRWIGGQIEQSGIEQDLQGIKSGYEGEARQFGGKGTGAMAGQKEMARAYQEGQPGGSTSTTNLGGTRTP